MSEITLDIPEETLEALKVTPETAGSTVRMAAAAKLYETGRLSSGVAADLAGVPRTVFLSRLSEYGVATFDVDDEEMSRETRLA